MTSDIEWGAEIPVDGVRPVWLGDGDEINVRWGTDGCHWSGLGLHSWDYWIGPNPIKSIRLPASHWAYLPLSRGFTPWAGGDEAPGDWDGGSVMLLSERLSLAPAWWDRRYGPEYPSNIIGYRRRGEVTSSNGGSETTANGGSRGVSLKAEEKGVCPKGGEASSPIGGEPDTVTIKRMTEAEAERDWDAFRVRDLPTRLVFLEYLRNLGLIRPEPTEAERVAAVTREPVETVQRILDAAKVVRGDG